jgi:hypothetical protein
MKFFERNLNIFFFTATRRKCFRNKAVYVQRTLNLFIVVRLLTYYTNLLTDCEYFIFKPLCMIFVFCLLCARILPRILSISPNRKSALSPSLFPRTFFLTPLFIYFSICLCSLSFTATSVVSMRCVLRKLDAGL